MNQYILYFDSGNDFDLNLKIFLIRNQYNLIVIPMKKINAWQFFCKQNQNQEQSGFIVSPLGRAYDLSEVNGMYLCGQNFRQYFDNNYECNSWYAYFCWLAYNLPNKICNITTQAHINYYRTMYFAHKNKIATTSERGNHYAHCIGQNIFASKSSEQMAILPPKLAKKITNLVEKLGLDQAEISLSLQHETWKLSSITPQISWDKCAFPKDFIFQAFCKHLNKNQNNKWQFCKHKKIRNYNKVAQNYINNKLLPEVTGSSYHIIT